MEIKILDIEGEGLISQKFNIKEFESMIIKFSKSAVLKQVRRLLTILPCHEFSPYGDQCPA